MCRPCFRAYSANRATGVRRELVDAPAGMKACGRCRQFKALEAFPVSRQERHGRHSYCSGCYAAYKRERYRANDEARARALAYSAAHRDQQRAWAHTPAGRLSRRNRSGACRARKLGQPAVPINLAAVYEREDGRCWICGRAVPVDRAHFEHVIPIQRGGGHTQDNVRVACVPCNVIKSDRILTPELKASIAERVLSRHGGEDR